MLLVSTRQNPLLKLPLGHTLHYHKSQRLSSVGPPKDEFGRKHDYLRVSLTERCNLRCLYCMPKEGIKLAAPQNYLNLQETKRLISVFVDLLHTRKVRFTGGEPTIDQKLVPLLEHLSDSYRGQRNLSIGITTNGLRLHKMAGLYKSLGVGAVNVSLDTLKPDRFLHMTRTNAWNQAHLGLMTAIKTEFEQVKLNCVVIKGVNDDEVLDFVELARLYPIQVRFIEFMPFQGNGWSKERMMTYKSIKDRIKEKYPSLVRMAGSASETCKVFKDASMAGSIGFISSMSDNFCAGCNRLRLTADGNLKVCLFDSSETSLRDLIRADLSDEDIAKVVQRCLQSKKEKHSGLAKLQLETSRPMIKIGECDSNRKLEHTFTHLDSQGRANMVNVGFKEPVKRVSIARGRIQVGPVVLKKLSDLSMKKGDVISVARVAGIQAAKSTSNLIPLCHQVPLSGLEIEIESCNFTDSIIVTATVEANYNTGVEMESLTAVSVSLLTIYDMCKSVNKQMVISDIMLVSKIKS